MYSPTIKSITEGFENANRYLPIMEWHRFGTLPIFEKFNSHALSELFTGLLYSWIFNTTGEEIFIYDFAIKALGLVLSYWVLVWITGDIYCAVFGALFFPYMTLLVPEYFSIALLAIPSLLFLIHSPKKHSSSIILIVTTVVLCLWRIDIGTAVIGSYLGCLLIARIKGIQISILSLCGSILIVSGSTALVAITIFFASGRVSWENLHSILSFIRSAQAHGYEIIGDTTHITYWIHYFIFPVYVAFFAVIIALVPKSMLATA